MKRAALAALFCFILPSCSNPRLWHHNSIKGPCPEFSSSIIYYSPPCPESSIGFQILTTWSGRYYYIQVYSIPITTPQVEVSASCCSQPITGNVLLGGQRIWIPSYFGEAILNTVQDGGYVTIKVGRYEHTLSGDSVRSEI